jgi:hypothetical protein
MYELSIFVGMIDEGYSPRIHRLLGGSHPSSKLAVAQSVSAARAELESDDRPTGSRK